MEVEKQYDENGKTTYISRTKNIYDENGDFHGTETEIYKRVYGDTNFWKVWLGDLLHALDLISNSKQLDVVFYVLQNTDPATNLYINTLMNTAKETEVSYKTVYTIFKKMLEVDMIKKKQNGVYFVKPELLLQGGNAKKRRLCIEYEQIGKEKNENGKE